MSAAFFDGEFDHPGYWQGPHDAKSFAYKQLSESTIPQKKGLRKNVARQTCRPLGACLSEDSFTDLDWYKWSGPVGVQPPPGQ
jgi:hypothetical protein